MQQNIMTRSVSREDCLLGRGANPRTGLITPGSSVDSDIGQTYANAGTSMTPPAKWRQKGDEWISLDIGEPTSLPNLSVEQHLSVSKLGGRTPPRCGGQGFSLLAHASPTSERLRIKGNTHVKAFEDLSAQTMNHGRSPGTCSENSIKQPAQKLVRPPVMGAVIKRKPVAGGTNPGQLVPAPLRVLHKTGQVPFTTKCELKGDIRSFSVPDPDIESSTTIETGPIFQSSNSPTKRQTVYDNHPGTSHIGIRSTTLNDVQHSSMTGWASRVSNLDKELPCLPTNSSTITQKRSESAPLNFKDPIREQIPETAAICPQQDQPSTTSECRTRTRNHIADMMHLSKRGGQEQVLYPSRTQGIFTVPNYDNPPRLFTSDQNRAIVAGPGSMPRPSQQKMRKKPLERILDDPFHTNIDTTPTLTVRRQRQRHLVNARDLPKCRQPPSIPLPPTPHPPKGPRYTSTTDGATTSKEFTVKTNLNLSGPWIAQQPPQGPHMSPRSIGIPQVSWMTPEHCVNVETTLELPDQLKVTGVPTPDSKVYTTQSRPVPTEALADLDQTFPSQKQEIQVDSSSGKPEQDVPVGPKRRCSRCHGGFISLKSPTLDKHLSPVLLEKSVSEVTRTPESVDPPSLPEGDIKPQEIKQADQISFSNMPSKTTATSHLNEVSDHRDHSACCPQCCQEDCHEGCLGHPSQRSSPKKQIGWGEKILQRTDSSSTLMSDSEVSSTSLKSEEKRSKHSIVKSTFKIPFWSKGNSHITPKSSNNSLKEAIPPDGTNLSSQIMAGLVKPTHGHDNAAVAAKKATGCSSLEKEDQSHFHPLTVLKKRSNLDGPAREHLHDDATVSALTPPPTPPSIKISTNTNERRKRSAIQSEARLKSSSRAIPGASTEVRPPSVESMSLVKLTQVFLAVPFEATRMWVYNNPQIIIIGKSAVGHGLLMICVVTTTSKLLFNSMYIYSKTGRFRIKDANGNRIEEWQFITDVMRSAVFLLTFAILTLLLGRLVAILLLPLKFFITIGRYITIGGQSVARL